MARIRVSRVIDAPPDAVWEQLRHIERHVDWMADAESIRFTSRQREGLGTAFDCRTRVGPFRLTDRMEITAWRSGRRMGVRHHGLVTGTGEFRLATARRRRGRCTRLTWDERITFPWWFGGPVAALGAKPVLKRIWRRNLRTLAGLVERTPHDTSRRRRRCGRGRRRR